MSQLPFWFRKKVQNRFSTWLLGWRSWISDQNDFSYFLSTSHPDTSYLFESIVKNRFSRWQLWWPSCIPKQNDFSYFWSTNHPDAICQVLSQLAFRFRRSAKKFSKIGAMEAILDFILEWFELFFIHRSTWRFLPSFQSIGLSVQEKRKIDFQDGSHGIQSENLAIFDLQVTPLLPTKIQVSWPFGSGEEVKNRFSRWQPWQPSWIFDQNNFGFLLINKSPKCFLSAGLSVQEKKQKIDFQDGGHSSHFGFQILTDFSYFCSTSDPDASYQVSSPLVFQFKRRSEN